MNALLNAIRQRTTPEQRRFIKFCFVGSSGVAVNLAFVYVGRQVGESNLELSGDLRDAFASVVGILVSVFTNFLLNDWWTWGDRAKGARKRDFLARVGWYYLASGAAIAIQFGVAMVLLLAADMLIYVAQAIGILLGTVVNYVANNKWTFRDKGTEADDGQADDAAEA